MKKKKFFIKILFFVFNKIIFIEKFLNENISAVSNIHYFLFHYLINKHLSIICNGCQTILDNAYIQEFLVYAGLAYFR